jgi:small-conductance mechanosensitive channel
MRLVGLVVLLGVVGAPQASRAEVESATLRYFNRDIAVLRAPLLGAPPAQRVAAAEVRLEATVNETAGAEVTLSTVDLGRAVLLNGRLIFFIQPGDVDPEAGLDLDASALAAADRLRDALAQSAEQRHSDSLVRSSLMAGGALLVYLLIAGALIWLRTRVVGALERLLGSRAGPLRVGSLGIIRWKNLNLIVSGLVRALSGFLLLALGVQWLALALRQYPYARPWGERLQGLIGKLVGRGLELALQALPDLVVVVLIVWVARWSTGVSTSLFRQAQAGRLSSSWLTPETAAITNQLVSVAIWLFALVMAYPYLPGSQSEAFKGLTVLVGVMASLGASSTVGQAASGLILIYTRAFSVGDQVRIGESAGTVTAIGMFTTRLRTMQGEELVIPNAKVLAATTKNYRLHGARVRLEVTVTIGYDTPWRQVQALLLEGVKRTGELLADEEAEVLIISLDDFYVSYRLLASGPATQPRDAVLAVLRRNVLDAFTAAQVQIMSPHYRADPATPKVAPLEAPGDPT